MTREAAMKKSGRFRMRLVIVLTIIGVFVITLYRSRGRDSHPVHTVQLALDSPSEQSLGTRDTQLTMFNNQAPGDHVIESEAGSSVTHSGTSRSESHYEIMQSVARIEEGNEEEEPQEEGEILDEAEVEEEEEKAAAVNDDGEEQNEELYPAEEESIVYDESMRLSNDVTAEPPRANFILSFLGLSSAFARSQDEDSSKDDNSNRTHSPMVDTAVGDSANDNVDYKNIVGDGGGENNDVKFSDGQIGGDYSQADEIEEGTEVNDDVGNEVSHVAENEVSDDVGNSSKEDKVADEDDAGDAQSTIYDNNIEVRNNNSFRSLENEVSVSTIGQPHLIDDAHYKTQIISPLEETHLLDAAYDGIDQPTYDDNEDGLTSKNDANTSEDVGETGIYRSIGDEFAAALDEEQRISNIKSDPTHTVNLMKILGGRLNVDTRSLDEKSKEQEQTLENEKIQGGSHPQVKFYVFPKPEGGYYDSLNQDEEESEISARREKERMKAIAETKERDKVKEELLREGLSAELIEAIFFSDSPMTLVNGLAADIQSLIRQSLWRLQSYSLPEQHDDEAGTVKALVEGGGHRQDTALTDSGDDDRAREKTGAVQENSISAFIKGRENNSKSDNFWHNKDGNEGREELYAKVPKAESAVYNNLPKTTSNYDAVYLNPRPLSEEDFEDLRTKPYGGNRYEETNTKPPSAFSNLTKENEWPMNMRTNTANLPETEHSAESRADSLCPRQTTLAEVSHPVTALVSFPGAVTQWMRRILEQLTGETTDSVYSVVARLRSDAPLGSSNLSRKSVIETHYPEVRQFQRGIVLIGNPFTVETAHKHFRPKSTDWQMMFLWPQTYKTWLRGDLPLHVVMYDDLIQQPLTEMVKIADFMEVPKANLNFDCAVEVMKSPPDLVHDVTQIAGLYHSERKKINANIDEVISVAKIRFPNIVEKLNSYKVDNVEGKFE